MKKKCVNCLLEAEKLNFNKMKNLVSTAPMREALRVDKFWFTRNTNLKIYHKMCHLDLLQLRLLIQPLTLCMQGNF